jgi:protein O-mannosyl-transferase
VGTLVPVIGIVQVGRQAMADRHMYIPMMGLIVALVWLADGTALTRRWGNRPLILGPVVVLLVLSALTWRQVRFWHDDITLWSYNLEVTTKNVVAEDNLGIALLQAGRTEDALPHFYKAISVDPSDAISAANVATDLLAHGRTEEAIAKYEIALANAAHIPMLLPNIHSNLGSAFLNLGNYDKARDHYTLALDLNPQDQVARTGLRKIQQHSQINSITK